MDTKKISFGIKLKKTTLIKAENTQGKSDKKDVQFIDCLEESSIKVIGGDDEKTKEPLVIPMKPNKKLLNLEDIVKNNFVVENDVQNGETSAVDERVDVNPNENLSLNELAAKELLQDAKNGDVKETKSKRVIETVHPDKLALEGEKESTLDDYEDVPVEEFGLAMLRGMGWKEGSGIGKNQKVIAAQQPVIRPKGLGLGADKVAKQNNSKPAVDKEGKPLICCKGAFVKVIAGYHKGTYGQIIGLDDESGRFIVKTAMNNMNISLNEFLVTPVTKEDYNKNSKVINNAKYEEYLKKIEQAKNNLKNYKSSSEEERKSLKKSIKKEKFSDSGSNDEHYSKTDKKPIKTEKYSSEEEKYGRKNHHEKSDDSDDSDNRKSRKHKHKKNKDRSSSKKRDKKYKSSSESSDESVERHRSSKKEERGSRSSKNEEKSSRNDARSSRYDKDNYSRYDDRSSRNDDRSSRKESRSTRYDNEYSDNRRDEKSSRYEDRSSRYEDRSSRNDRSSKYDDKYSSKSKYNSRKRSSSRSSEESSSSEEERSRKKSSKHRRDRSSERNSHKSSYKDKERERSRHDKYRR